MYYIGIDLGGTNVAAGMVDEGGKLLGKASIPCPRGSEAIADAIAQAARLAHREGIPLKEAVLQCGFLTEKAYEEAVDPEKMV